MLAQHLIFGAYGFWLPNDPPGSGSSFVGAWDLFRADVNHNPGKEGHPAQAWSFATQWPTSA